MAAAGIRSYPLFDHNLTMQRTRQRDRSGSPRCATRTHQGETQSTSLAKPGCDGGGILRGTRSRLMRVDLALNPDSRWEKRSNIGLDAGQRATAIRGPSSGPAFHRAATPSALDLSSLSGALPPRPPGEVFLDAFRGRSSSLNSPAIAVSRCSRRVRRNSEVSSEGLAEKD